VLINPSRAVVTIDGKFAGPAGNFGFAQTIRFLPVSMKCGGWNRAKKGDDDRRPEVRSPRDDESAIRPAQPPFKTLKTHNADHVAADATPTCSTISRKV
jgi:hypothetical protein